MKIHKDGFIEIKSMKDAKEALKRFQDLKVEIDELKEESGLNDLERDAVAYKAGLQKFMIAKGKEQLQGDGYHGTLIKTTASSRWIATHGDLDGSEPAGTKPLREIIEKKFKGKVTEKGSAARRMWMAVTKRTVDVEALTEQVDAGELTTDEIAPALVETFRTPYLRVFEDAENDG